MKTPAICENVYAFVLLFFALVILSLIILLATFIVVNLKP